MREAAKRLNGRWRKEQDSHSFAHAEGVRDVNEEFLTHQNERQREMVRKKGLEPSRPCGRQPLKLQQLTADRSRPR